MTELDDRIVRYAISHLNIPGDAVINLQHSVRPGSTTFFELSALLRHLRSVLLRSRALVPADLLPASSTSNNPNVSQSIDPGRVTGIRDALHDLGQRVQAFDPATGDVDTVIDRAVDLFEQTARFGLEQTGWGFLYEWRRRAYAELLANVRTVVVRWNDRLSSSICASRTTRIGRHK